MRTCLEVERMFPFIKGVETVLAVETGTEAHDHTGTSDESGA